MYDVDCTARCGAVLESLIQSSRRGTTPRRRGRGRSRVPVGFVRPLLLWHYRGADMTCGPN